MFGKPLAPRIIAPILQGRPTDEEALATGRRLADFDSLLVGRLSLGSLNSVGLEIARVVDRERYRIASVVPYGGDGALLLTVLPIAATTTKRLRTIAPRSLRELTIGMLFEIEGFGAVQLLDYLASLEVAAERGLLEDSEYDMATPPAARGIIAWRQQSPVEVARIRNEAKRAFRRIVVSGAMYERWIHGEQLEQIGRSYGLSRERVRQVIKEGGHDVEVGKQLSSAARTAAAERERQSPFETHRDEIISLIEGGASLDEIWRKTGVTASLIREMVRKDPTLERLRWMLHTKNTFAKNYSTEELITCMREANNALGGILSTSAYTEHASTRVFDDGRPWPTHQTMGLRFGGWRAALAAAGLQSNAPSAIAGQVIFSREHCIDALAEVARRLGHMPTVVEYEEAVREGAGYLPSVATVRNRLGSWQQALRLASEYI